MRKIVARTPSPEMQEKMKKAVRAVRDQKKRVIRCPYCQHSGIVIFEDTRGHIQTKCTCCKKEVVVDVMNMRRLRGLSEYARRLKKTK